MEYIRPEALYLLFLIVPFFLVKLFFVRSLRIWRQWRFIALLLAFASLLIALSAPFYFVSGPSRAFLVLFDISRSMTVDDMRDDRGMPLSRLAFAKNELKNIISGLPAGTAIGIGAAVTAQWEFEANANIKIFWPIQPIKEEKMADIYRALAIADWWNAWGDGSQLLGFVGSLQWLVKEGHIPPRTTVILFSDGGEPIPFDKENSIALAARSLKEKDIRLVFVGVGGSVPRFVPDFDEQLRNTGKCFVNPETQECFQSALDETNLRNLAAKFSSRYQRLSKSEDLVSVFADKNNPITGEEKVRRDVSWIFALCSFVFLIFSFI